MRQIRAKDAVKRLGSRQPVGDRRLVVRQKMHRVTHVRNFSIKKGAPQDALLANR